MHTETNTNYTQNKIKGSDEVTDWGTATHNVGCYKLAQWLHKDPPGDDQWLLNKHVKYTSVFVTDIQPSYI